MTYRQDIDGLRAIAVLFVIIFHAKVGVLSGGFVGVDIFFVISGYLITSILLRDIKAPGRFSILSFYERRIRRIFPALISVILFSSVTASLIFLPAEFKDFGQSLVATGLFLSNMLFWKEAGYFAGPSEIKTAPPHLVFGGRRADLCRVSALPGFNVPFRQRPLVDYSLGSDDALLCSQHLVPQ